MFRRLGLGIVLSVAMIASLLPFERIAAAASTGVVISQVYGGGGNTGAQYQNDFIELFNRGSATVSVAGWSVQYTSATGTGNFGSATNLITPLSGSLAPGQYLLVQEASGTNGVALPAPDVTDSTPINMSATGGKVALVNTTTPLGCNGGSTPCSAAALSTIVDLLGYDGANFFEGASAAPALSNTTAAFRAGGGCVDTDSNGADFVAAAPAPRNTASALGNCTDQAPAVTATSPLANASGVALSANITITFSEPVNLAGSPFAIACDVSGAHSAATSGGPTTFTLDPDADFANSESCRVTVSAASVTDQDALDPPDTMASDFTFSFTTVAPTRRIHEIQGAAHLSPYAGQLVGSVPGVVTAKRANGFYMQDPSPDADDATSEGILVFTGSAPSSIAIGDAVTVSARVQEFRPGGATNGNLTTTELGSPTVTVVSHGNPLPAPVVIGTGGRVPPSEIIEDDATGSVETSGVFDPATDGVDFYESLEGMLVQLDDAVAVGPTNAFGETPVVGDDGAHASVRTPRGGILLRANDGNPERLVADDAIVAMPALNVGDHYSGPLVGVLDYNFGNFFLEVTSAVTRVDGGLARETTRAPGADELAVATFNVENLDPTDPQSKFDRLAGLIVDNLRSPDLIAVEEIQDNTGPRDNGVTAADVTIGMLTAAIQAAGGPAYAYREIDPVNDQDGGEPGGNIRQIFMFRTDRGLAFVDRPGGGSTTPTTVVSTPAGPQLSASPGRIAPANGAWTTSRKPLAGEFTYNTRHLFVIANHFNSKGGDDPLMGRFQPPTRISEVQRHKQAQVEHDFVASIFAADEHADVVVLGDLNDFEFSDTVSILKGDLLDDLYQKLPENERYSYVFEGNSQTLDHILVSKALRDASAFDPVHVNAEFADQASDHDPSVAFITLRDNVAPTIAAAATTAPNAAGWYRTPVTVHFTCADNSGTVTCPADVTLTADGAGQSVTGIASDPTGNTASATVSGINIDRTAPTIAWTGHASYTVDERVVITCTPADALSGLVTASTTCPAIDQAASTLTLGTHTLTATAVDVAGNTTTSTFTFTIGVTETSLCALVRQLSTSVDVSDGLCDKLAAIASARERGNEKVRANVVAAFINQVEAQRGKAIASADADLLVALVKAL